MHPTALPTTTATVALLLTLTLLALTGCGSNTGAGTAASGASTAATSPTTTATPQPGFTGSVEAVCVKHNHAFAALTSSVSTQAQLKHVIGERAVIERATLKELETLQPPTRTQAPWRAFLAARRRLINAEDALARRGTADHGGTLFQAVGPAQEQLTKAAQTGGFKECAAEP